MHLAVWRDLVHQWKVQCQLEAGAGDGPEAEGYSAGTVLHQGEASGQGEAEDAGCYGGE